VTTYVVIGGGVSGLAAARVLAGECPAGDRPADEIAGAATTAPAGGAGGGGAAAHGGTSGASAHVIVLEASDQLGGKVRSGRIGGEPVELGPDQFLRRDPSAERLCRRLGLGDDLLPPSALSAAVFSHGTPRQLPAGLVLGVPTDLDALAASGIVGPEAIEYAHEDPERPGRAIDLADVGLDGSSDTGRERSAGAVLRPRLGDEIVDRLVDPLIGGINAATVDGLSLGTVAPQIARALVGHRDVIVPLTRVAPRAAVATPVASPFLGLAGGLARIVTKLGAELRNLGCDLRLGCPALALTSTGSGYLVDTPGGQISADGVVIAVPGPVATRLLEQVAPQAASALSTIAYSSVAVVTYVFEPGAVASLEGWSGVLVPRVEGALMTAVTFLTKKWPWMEHSGRPLVRVSAGRHLDDRIAALGDAELARELASDLERFTGIDATRATANVHRWTQAFPQYAPGYAARITTARRALAEAPTLQLAGATLGGIGIPACITSGEHAALAVLAASAARQ
jgi:protoporphyrinogen/coproporphyrinogen III oxidase